MTDPETYEIETTEWLLSAWLEQDRRLAEIGDELTIERYRIEARRLAYLDKELSARGIPESDRDALA